MKSQTLRSLALGTLITAATFDALTVPVARLSIADCSMLLTVGAFGVNRDTLRRSCYFLFWIVPIVLLINAAIFFFYQARSAEVAADLSLLGSGFVRPIFFVLMSIGFYGVLERKKFSSAEIHQGVAFAAFLITAVVVLQYFGIAPPMYHNNPSFGETGRYTVFSEGWRPTGLTNEASFVGIFIFLLFVTAVRASEKSSHWHFLSARFCLVVAFLGCFFTTSRLALLLAVAVLVMQRPSFKKIFISIFLLLLVLPFLDIDRFQNVLAFEGDASTIERYGSLFAYASALVDPACIWGTGYLNSGAVISSHISALVLGVLGDRQLPAFSLPLQLAVELGPIVFLGLVLFVWIKWIRHIRDIRLNAVILVSFLTGIQNFIFVYIFVALVFYDRYTCSTQDHWRSGAHRAPA